MDIVQQKKALYPVECKMKGLVILVFGHYLFCPAAFVALGTFQVSGCIHVGSDKRGKIIFGNELVVAFFALVVSGINFQLESIEADKNQYNGCGTDYRSQYGALL